MTSLAATSDRTEVVHKLTDIWNQVLNRSDVGVSDGFLDLGGDSLTAVAMADIVSQEFGCAFEALMLFEYPCVDRIADFVCEHLARERLRKPGGADAAGSGEALPGADVAAEAPEALPDYYEQSVAIIGISCHFPGARDHRELWENLLQGRESIARLSAAELRSEGVEERLIAHPGFVPVRTTLPDKQTFDPEFFRISAREADATDPQVRQLLQHAWRAVEDAGYTPAQIPDTSVFVSTANHFFAGRGDDTTAPFTLEDFADYQRWLLSQSGTAPTAISYRLGLRGPSLSVNANCSSSLVGMNLAFGALVRGDTRYALVGAASLSWVDGVGYLHQKGLNLSGDGHVRAFDEAADGMVAGEGVALLLLKRASDAFADGDHVYAVIRGVAVNNDGEAKPGYYAPSTVGQADVISRALTQAEVHPDSISFVEAHGTGTALGDPIEVAALTQAYRAHGVGRQYCALGSIKSNIGHMDTAAGLAGVIKAALALEQGVLPPTINVQRPNPKLRLAESPFFLATERHVLAPRAVPHRAGVSSFGIGGTNTHAILEQVRPKSADARGSSGAVHVFPLSARGEQRLRAQAQTLIDFLPRLNDPQLADLAFTLQRGRVALPVRAAFVASNLTELATALRHFVAGSTPAPTPPAVATALLELVERWRGGQDVDWVRLNPDAGQRRLSLPSFPFDGRAFAQRGLSRTSAPARSEARPHPLLHRGLAAANGGRFSSTFDGREPIFADHVVQGRALLAGATQLEMARAAASAAAKPSAKQSISLRDVVWTSPIVATDAAIEVTVAVEQTAEGAFSFELFDAKREQRAVFTRGLAELSQQIDSKPIDLSGALAASRSAALTGDACYARFRAAGIEYGPSHRVITSLRLGEEQLVARLELPSAFREPRYGLHPSLLDGAFQAVAGLVISDDSPNALSVPYALARLDLLRPCPEQCWALVRRSDAPASACTFDLDLVDDAGNVCVSARGFATRPLTPRTASLSTDADLSGDLLLQPAWSNASPLESASFPALTQKALLLGDADECAALREVLPDAVVGNIGALTDPQAIAARLAEAGRFEQLIWVANTSKATARFEDESWLVAQRHSALQAFALVKALLATGYGEGALTLTVVTRQTQRVDPTDEADPTHATLIGFFGSAVKEQPSWQLRLVDVAAAERPLWSELLRLPASRTGQPFAQRRGSWLRQQLIPCVAPQLAPDRSRIFRQGGVYVVIGGAGGLGVAWTEMVIRDFQAHVVWLGRRDPDARIVREIERLGQLGPAPLYLPADAADLDSLQRAYLVIKQRHAKIDGVIQAALVLRDQSVGAMDAVTFDSVLRAKLDASVRTAQVFAPEQLDFLLFFSSLLSFVKSPGQSNYAAGCTYQDAFAHWLGSRLPLRVRVVNWGYWGTVGSVATPQHRERMAKAGIGSIDPEKGLSVIDTLLDSALPQLAFLTTNRAPAGDWIRNDQRVELLPAGTASVLDALPERSVPPSRELHGCAGPADLDALAGKLLQIQLLASGLLDPQGLSLQVGLQRVPVGYHRWYTESLRSLAERGQVLASGGVYRAITEHDPQDTWREWEDRCRRAAADPALKAQLDLVDATLRALPSILRGEQPATNVIFPGGSLALVEGVYKNNPTADYFNVALARLVSSATQHLLAARPSEPIRILEIGAGTGGTTEHVLQQLEPWREGIAEYCYTDVSKAFLNHGQRTFGPRLQSLTCRLLDIEQPLRAQGFTASSYDLVIATNCLHATRNIRATLRHAKAALRRGGLLMLNEMSQNSLFLHLTFGLLEGWWRFEDASLRIAGSPSLTPDAWRQALLAEGFQNVRLPATDAAHLGQQLFVAESDGAVRLPHRSSTTPAPEASASSHAPTAVTSADDAGSADLRQTVTECVASALQVEPHTITSAQSFGDYGVDSIIAVDLIGSLNERLGLTLQTIVLFEHDSVDKLVSFVARQRPRTEAANVPPVSQASVSLGSAQRVVLERPADVADIRVVECPLSPLLSHEVRIAVRAFSLNFSDLLCVRGLYPNMPAYPFTPGAEVSGVVLELGENVQGLRPGDEVIALMGPELGGHSSVVTCNAKQVLPKPSNLTFEQACSLPVVGTAVVECFRRAAPKRGEKILIQTACGGTGLLALQLAAHHGLEVYATAGSEAKLDYLRSLGVSQCINYVTSDFEQEIARLTNGRGVDIVFNTLGGDALEKGIRCLAPSGRYVELAMTALRSARTVDLSSMYDNQTLHSIDMRRLFLANGHRFEDCKRELLQLIESGVLRPTLSRVFELQQLGDAYRLLADRQSIGKVVVRVSDGVSVQDRPSPATPRYASPPEPTPGAGLRSFSVAGATPISGVLFYPSLSAARPIPLDGFSVPVAMNGTPCESLKGLILLSHGYAGSELVHDNLALSLARHGYLVAALKHPGDNWSDRSLVHKPEYFSERPQQVSRVLDALLEDPQWKDRLLPGAVGALGHSMGGYTVLALLGARVDAAKITDYLTQPTSAATQLLLGSPVLAHARDLHDGVKSATARQLVDERIRAGIVMAPCWSIFDHGSLGRLDKQLLAYVAERDCVIDATYDGSSLEQLLGAGRVRKVQNSGHFSFTAGRARSATTLGQELAELMADPPGFDRATFHRTLERELGSFFDAALGRLEA